jgi:thioredoxin reductase
MTTETSPPLADVAIVGGSYAGMSAALQLARARRRVVVIDAGVPRNRFAGAAHGFLAQDGRPPDAIASDARTQLLAYPTVEWRSGVATEAARDGEGFALGLADQTRVHARRVVLATGVVDTLPEVDGLAERWGTHVFHCPYCHGYELNRGAIGVIAAGPAALHQSLLLPDWGEVTLFTNGALVLDDDQRRDLAGRGVRIEPAPVLRIVDTATVVLSDGRAVVLAGLFTQPRTRPATALAEHLGCAHDESPLGTFVRTDAMKATTVPGVFACGDTARAAGSVAFAVGDGALAGLSTHRSLLFETPPARQLVV